MKTAAIAGALLIGLLLAGCSHGSAKYDADCKKLEQARQGEDAASAEMDKVDINASPDEYNHWTEEYNKWVDVNNQILESYGHGENATQPLFEYCSSHNYQT